MYEPHELALLVPRMTEDEYKSLKKDIEAHGLIDPITLYKGQVLDGVSRNHVCRELGIEVRVVNYEGDAPADFVASKNLARRHLTPQQRLDTALALLPHYKKEAKKRQTDAVIRGNKSRSQCPPIDGHWDRTSAPKKHSAVDDAAKAAGIKTRTLERGHRVQKENAGLYEEVQKGKISLTAADKQIADAKKAAEKAKAAQSNGTGKSKPWNGKSNSKRTRELRERKKMGYTDLLDLQIRLNQLCVVFEAIHVEDLELDQAALDKVADVHDDLVTMGVWWDRTIMSVQAWLSTVQIRETITKLRNVDGRSPEEAVSFIRTADRLQRKLEGMLNA